MLNDLLRCQSGIPRRGVSIRDEGYGIVKRQSPPGRGVNAELRVHAAYNDSLYAVVSENSFQICPKKRIGSRLANPDVGCHDFQSGGELPCCCAVLKIAGLRLVLDEDDRSAGIPCFAGDPVDSADDTFTVKCLALTFAKALLNIDGKYGGFHLGLGQRNYSQLVERSRHGSRVLHVRHVTSVRKPVDEQQRRAAPLPFKVQPRAVDVGEHDQIGFLRCYRVFC